MESKRTRKSFKIQTLNTATGNPGWTIRIMAVNLVEARAKFTAENPGQQIHSLAPWTGRENR